MQHYILYQAYGSVDYVNECRYSLLKYLSIYNLKPPTNIGIVVYTDQPAYFEAFTSFFHKFQIKEISQTQIKEWRGKMDFVHRAKIEIIKEFLQHVEGCMLYMDTDTYIIEPVEQLFEEIENGVFIMHEYEGILDKSVNPDFHKWEKFLEGAIIDYNGKRMTFSKDLSMWNAGVIGMNDNSKYILDDVLSLTDAVYEQFPKHISEQFAFSYCFQQTGIVQSARKQIEHYWNLKEFRRLLNLFFKKNEEESIPNLVKLVNHLDAVSIQKRKDEYEKMPPLKKFIHSLFGKKWSIRPYEKKI